MHTIAKWNNLQKRKNAFCNILNTKVLQNDNFAKPQKSRILTYWENHSKASFEEANDFEQGAMIKRLYQDPTNEDCVLLKSENPNYTPIRIQKNEIRGLALVVGLYRIEA